MNNRLIAVVIEVADLDRSAALYRDGFGVPLKPPDDHHGKDRWVSGRHCATSWTEGAFLHFAIYEAKTDERTTHVQIAFEVDDLESALCDRDRRRRGRDPRAAHGRVGTQRALPRLRRQRHRADPTELTAFATSSLIAVVFPSPFDGGARPPLRRTTNSGSAGTRYRGSP